MNDANFSKCKFSCEMVSYMYGELALEETSAFERHLVECSACTDDFAAISSSRYEVYDWKKLEFDPLETPTFEIPLDVTEGISWADKVRAVFAHGWAVPAFATFAIVSVVAAGLIWRQSNVENLAKNTGPATATVPAKDENAAPLAGIAPTGSVDNAKEASVPVERTITRVSQSKGAAPKRIYAQAARATRERSVQIKLTTARNEQRTVPSLNDYPDEEDTSLRLAELLDDIGSR